MRQEAGVATVRRKLLVVPMLAVVVLVSDAAGANAQEVGPSAARQRTMWDVHYAVGPAVPLQFILSLAGGFLASMAALGLRRNALMPPELLDELESLLAGGKLDDAKELSAPPSAFANVVFAGLYRSDLGQDSVFRAVSLAAGNETIVLRRRAGYVLLTGIVVVLVGLVGFLVHLVEMLDVIAAMAGAANFADLADGTSGALVALVWGLILFVPLLFAWWFLRDAALKRGHEMKMMAEELLSRVHCIQ